MLFPSLKAGSWLCLPTPAPRTEPRQQGLKFWVAGFLREVRHPERIRGVFGGGKWEWKEKSLKLVNDKWTSAEKGVVCVCVVCLYHASSRVIAWKIPTCLSRFRSSGPSPPESLPWTWLALTNPHASTCALPQTAPTLRCSRPLVCLIHLGGEPESQDEHLTNAEEGTNKTAPRVDLLNAASGFCAGSPSAWHTHTLFGIDVCVLWRSGFLTRPILLSSVSWGGAGG